MYGASVAVVFTVVVTVVFGFVVEVVVFFVVVDFFVVVFLVVVVDFFVVVFFVVVVDFFVVVFLVVVVDFFVVVFLVVVIVSDSSLTSVLSDTDSFKKETLSAAAAISAAGINDTYIAKQTAIAKNFKTLNLFPPEIIKY